MQQNIKNLIIWIMVSISLCGGGYYLISLYTSSAMKFQITIYVLLSLYSIELILLYFLWEKFRKLINQYTIFISIVSLMIPIIFFCIRGSFNVYLNSSEAENNIKQNTHYNYKLIEQLEKKIKNDPGVFLWNDFNSDIYKKYLEYISQNYSEECREGYLRVIYEITQLNNINKSKRELIVVRTQPLVNALQAQEYSKIRNELAEDQIKLIPNIKLNLSFVMNNCQDFKQR
jgi:hypothetical protein